MITVHCRTALDINECWPTKLPCVPRVGDTIQSVTKRQNGFQLELEVRSVTWKYDGVQCEWYPHIELHMTSFHRQLTPKSNPNAAQGSIVAFYDWYAPLVERSPGAFI